MSLSVTEKEKVSVPNVEILVNHMTYETRVAVLEDGLIQDLFIERYQKKGLVGNIYKGRVQRVLPGMDAAFVEIGQEKAGFLHLKDLAFDANNVAQQSITDYLYEGQIILVQVLKDPLGTKGARLTTAISIPSRFLVYLPDATDIAVSIKIASKAQRQSLRDSMLGFHKGHQGGFIVRTAIESADIWAMRADMQYLYRLWESVLLEYKKSPTGALIYADLPLYLRVMRDFVSSEVHQVIVDDERAYQEMQLFADNFIVEMKDCLSFYQGDSRSLFERFAIEDEIEQALERRVPLKSGGYLIIDQTEAMTTIDVNTGAYVGKLSQEDTIYKTNLEAVKAIARQLRLRNLGGMIMLDLIDMQSPLHQQNIMDALEKALSRDKSKYTIAPISSLGIIEMTRKRTRESLQEIMCKSCPVCEGRGRVKNFETSIFGLFRELIREVKDLSPQKLTVVGDPNLIEYIREEEFQAFSDLQSFLKVMVRLESSAVYNNGQYEIAIL